MSIKPLQLTAGICGFMNVFGVAADFGLSDVFRQTPAATELGRWTKATMLARWILLIALSSGTVSSLLITPAIADQEPEQEIVVLLHGLGRTSRSMAPLETALSQHGYHTVNIGYPSTKEPIEQLAEYLGNELRKCCQAKNRRINFVTHSLGGILLRFYLAKPPLDNRLNLGRVVMLSPPNSGSELVDALRNNSLFRMGLGPSGQQLGTDPASIPNQLGPINFDLGIITGTRSLNPLFSWLIPGKDDGKVSVENAKAQGMTDFLVVPHTHTFIMNSKVVIAQTLHFLRNGAFDYAVGED